MQRHHKYIAAAATAGIVAATVIGTHLPTPTPTDQTVAIPSANHIGPVEAYPEFLKTPGMAATLNPDEITGTWTDNCPNGKASCTYSQDHRNVPPAEHQQVYDEYGIPPAQQNIQSVEVDHFYPLCAGGSNDLSNLWAMPISIPWNSENLGYKTKDKLESWICVQIKAGKMLPQDAFNQLTSDWVAMYETNKAAIESSAPTYGSISYDYDGDN